MPAARPSRPSMRLMILVKATIQTMVRAMDRIGLAVRSTTLPWGRATVVISTPNETSTSAAITCPDSLIHGDRWRISSTAPSTAIRVEATIIPINW